MGEGRTGSDGRIYPWGNQAPDEKRCNFGMTFGDTTPVGNYPNGASPCGGVGPGWEYLGVDEQRLQTLSLQTKRR